jgi:hypothetical protein
MAKEFGVCRDCKNWQITDIVRENIDKCSRDTHPKFGFLDCICMTLTNSLNITVSKSHYSSDVEFIETDANFGCVLFEIVEN